MKFLVLSVLVVAAACIDCKTGSGPCCDDATNTFKPAGLRCDMGGNDCEARYCTGSSSYCPTPVIENGKACSLNGQIGVCQGTTCVASYATTRSNDQNTSGNTVSDSTTTPTTVNQGYNGYTTIYQQQTTVVPVVKKSEYDNHPLLHKSLDDADIDFDDSDDDDDDDDDDEDTAKESTNIPCSGDCCNLLFSGAKPDGSICGHGGQCSKGECINQSCVGSCCKWMSDEALPDGSICGHGGQCSKGVCVKQTCLGECCSMWGWSDEPLEDGTPCSKGKCVSGVCMETNEYLPMPTLSAVKTSGADAKQRARRISTIFRHNAAQSQQAYKQPPTYQQAYQQVFQPQYQPQYQQQYQPQYQPQYQQQYQQPQYYQQQQYYQPAYAQQQYQAYQQPQYYSQQPMYQQQF